MMTATQTTHTAPGKSSRKGISLFDLEKMFPDEDTARLWFERELWGKIGRSCPNCGSVRTHEASHKKSPYRCSDCRGYFSVKTGTAMGDSRLPLRKWAFAIFLEVTSLKGISSMKLHRDISVTQKTAWFMLHRIREAFAFEGDFEFAGPVEVDETYIGGKRRNMSNAQRKALKDTGRGAVGKAAVVGIKDRATKKVAAKVIQSNDAETLQGFVRENVEGGATVYSDDAGAYIGLKDFEHDSVKHSIMEYVKGQVHTNGIESFWSMLKRAHKGTFHKFSVKHLQRYVNEFAGRQGMRELDTINQMQAVVAGMVCRRIMYRDLIA